MKINKKLSTAIVLSLMMGVYGNASAADTRLFGASGNGEVIAGVKEDKAATTFQEKATASGNEFTISAGEWGYVKGGYLVRSSGSEAGTVKNNNVLITGGYFGFISGAGAPQMGGYIAGDNPSNKAEYNSITINIETPSDHEGNYHVHGVTFGGYVSSGTAEGNTAILENGKIRYLEGGFVSKGTAIDNEAIVNGGTTDAVYGADVSEGDAISNKVTITGGTVSGNVYGGWNGDGSVQSNQVSISGGKIGYDASGNPILNDGNIYGGYTEDGLAQGNTVTISQAEGKTTQINGNVYGGYIGVYGTGNANNNIVNVSGGEMSTVEGGCTLNGSAVGNHVNVTGGEIGLWVIGGFSGLYGKATEALYASSNIVEISGTTVVHDDVSGGSVQDGKAINNVAIITGGTIGADVHGGEVANNGDATGNTVSINGASATEKVQVTGKVYGGKSANGAANNNKVGVVDGTGALVGAATNFTAQVVYGGYGTTGATGNKVWLGEGAIASGVYGGEVDFTKGSGNANNNEVKITNGASVTLGVTGGCATKGAATENTVVIDSSTVGSYVTGGMSDRHDATGNIVTINNSELGYQVYGGWATGKNANAKGNTVTISGDSTRINSIIYGGQSDNGIAGGSEAGEGNTVTVSGGQFRRAIFGGASADSDAINNTVNFENGTIKGDIYGGSGSDIDDYGGTKWIGSGNAIGNAVNITGGKIALENSEGGNVYGGYTLQGNVSENTVTIDGGEIAKDVYGGKTENGDAIKNVVEMNNATVNGTSRGGRAENGAANENIIRVTNSTTNDSVTGGNSVNGTANKNIAEITDSTIKGNVFGAWSAAGAQENQVTITGSSILHDVYGSYALAGDATSNSVTISGGKIVNSSKFVYGGYAVNGNATSNTVTIEGGTISSVVIGGHDDGVADSGKVTDGNKVTITGGTINNAVYGGSSANNNALNNSVEINGSAAKITGNVYGGSSWGYNGIAKGNKVDVKNGTLNKDVIGGFSGEYNVEENVVSISGGTISGNVYGGDTVKGNASKNTVEISGGTVRDIVYGGKTEKGTANNNKVGTADNVAANFTSGSIYGGRATTGAKGNEVHIGEGADVKYSLYGGYSDEGLVDSNLVSINGSSDKKVKVNSFVYGGDTVYGASKGNKVGSEDNVATNFTADYVYGGRGETGAEGNEVYLGEGVVVSKEVYGGRAGSGAAKDNKVYITDDANVTNADVYGGKSVSSSATSTGNTLNIDTWTGSKTMKSISDFQAINVKDTRDIKVGNADGLAEGGVVLDIQDSTLNLSTMGKSEKVVYLTSSGSDDFSTKFSSATLNGYEKDAGLWSMTSVTSGVDASQAKFQIDEKEAFVSVTESLLAGTFTDDKGNTASALNVDGEYDLTAGAKDYEKIYGAYNASGAAQAMTVNMAEAADLSSSTVWGNNVSAEGNTLNVKANDVKVGGLENFESMNFFIPADAAAGDKMLTVGTDVDLTNVKVAAGFHNDTALGYGDKVILIDATSVTGMDGVSEVKVDDTDFTEYDVMVYQGDSGMNQVESGATTLVAEMANMELKENSKVLAETIIAGATVISDGSDMLAGAGFDSAVSAIAADLETGAPSGKMSMFGAISGNKSKVHTGSHVDVKGWNMNLGFAKELKNKDGKMIIGPVVEYGRGDYDSYLDNGYHGEGNSHYVGGGVMAKQINDNGNYFEGSLRSGKLTNEFKSTGGSYDHDVTYLAGHIGLGHVQKMNEKNSMDYYAKYFHTHVAGDDIKVNAKGKDLDMTAESMTSARLRVGTRLNHKMSAKSSYYIGFAWQREFSGTAEASLAGKEIASPSMKGNSGFMELGVKLFDSSRYDLDLGGFGSVGKKEGAGFNFNFNWKF